MTHSRSLVILVFLACAMLAPGCSLESKYYHPHCREFPTPPGIEDVFVTTEDGVKVHAWFVPAPALAAGKVQRAPLILFCPGNRSQIDVFEPGLVPLGEAAGASVMLVSYRGYGRSQACEKVTRRHTLMDARAVFKAALQRTDVDGRHLAIMGYSIGGVPAMALAAERKDVAAAIVGGTYSNAADALDDTGNGLAFYVIGSDLDPADSALHYGNRPLFLFHGRADELIRPYHVMAIAASALKGGADVRVELIEGADHYNVIDWRPTLLAEMAEFLRQAWGDDRNADTANTAASP